MLRNSTTANDELRRRLGIRSLIKGQQDFSWVAGTSKTLSKSQIHGDIPVSRCSRSQLSSKTAQGAPSQLTFTIIMVAIAAFIIIMLVLLFYGKIQLRTSAFPGINFLKP